MAKRLFANNVSTKLASALTSVATTLSVTTGTGSEIPEVVSGEEFPLTLLPADTSPLTVNPADMEIVLVTAHTAGADSMTISRAHDGSSAKAWSQGAQVIGALPRSTLQLFPQLQDAAAFLLQSFRNTVLAVPASSWFSQATVNTGVAVNTQYGVLVQTDTTANSSAIARLAGSNSVNADALQIGQAPAILDWSKQLVWAFFLAVPNGTTNGVVRVLLGPHPDDGVQALDDKGLGIQVDNTALKGVVHNGSAGATVDLSTTLTSVVHVRIVSDGSGNVEWFVNGTSVGTSAAGPTGLSTAAHVFAKAMAENNADAVNQDATVSHMHLAIAQ